MTNEKKKPELPRQRNVIRTRVPAYFFGSGKAAATNPSTKRRKPSMPVIASCGCVFCDLRLAPVDGMHATEDGTVKCPLTRVREDIGEIKSRKPS